MFTKYGNKSPTFNTTGVRLNASNIWEKGGGRGRGGEEEKERVRRSKKNNTVLCTYIEWLYLDEFEKHSV